MSDQELSPKAPRPRKLDVSAFGRSAHDGFATEPEEDASTTPALPTPQQRLQLADLVEQSVLPLDPATPRTPKHLHAEELMTTGTCAAVLKKHMDAVVKVYCTHSKPNFELPWQVRQQTSSKSTGFAVLATGSDRWILTNAHSITYGAQVQLKKRGDDERYEAQVLAIGTECDVALLTVQDPLFWKDLIPLELSGELPELQESVAVVGYPVGGESLAISAGVVSRVQITHYSHGCTSLLALQTDASINSGNSGGPVLNTHGRCVGIAFQSLTGDAQLIGYVIPACVVRHFLEDVARHGRYTGFPSLNIGWQDMGNKSLKESYDMGPHQRGILVRSVVQAAAEAEVLQVDDVIQRVAGIEIGCDGTVPFRHGERVDLKHVVTKFFVGDLIQLDILRGGEELSVQVKLQPFLHLVPPHLEETKPSFFMIGGLVFTPLTDPYLVQRYGSLSSSPVRILTKTYYGTKARGDEQVVILTNILACSAAIGYDVTVGLKDSAVVAFNGERVWSLVQLARMVTECKDKFLRFEMEAANKVIVMDAGLARECTKSLCERENMASPMSKDVEAALAVAAP